MHPFPTMDEMRERIERILRGEDISTPVIEAGSIPICYGSEHPADAWARMHRDAKPEDAAFYQAGAIGWASR